jgi:aminopeptidase YwaD
MLGEFCTGVRENRFSMHPASLFAIGKIFAGAYLIGFLMLLVHDTIGLIAGLAAMALGLVYFFSQFILYRGDFDGLFKKVEAGNIIGTIEPRSGPKRQVVIVGHHDSAPIYRFYQKAPWLFPIRLLSAVASYLFCFVSLAISLASALPAWAAWVVASGALFALPMYGYMSKRGSPGAGDNLIACAIGLEIAEHFRRPVARLESTRVVIVFTDGEEVGQKGAASFVKENEAMLRELDTEVINLDSIYTYEDLVLLGRDRNGFTRLSAGLAREIQGIAAGLGHEVPIASIPFLGGGTDGAQFALRGFRTASIIAQPIKAFSKEIIFHTMKDMPDRISKKAVAAVIELVAEYIKALDLNHGSD